MSELEKYSAGGYLPASFLDWEGHVTAVVFTSGCNFRCPWCHNGDLVLCKTGHVSLTGIIEDLKRRYKFLDGVVITGGEPCIWDGLIPLLRELKVLRIPVKLDTNGSLPEILSEVLNERLVDYVAMDVKAPLDIVSQKRLTGVAVSVNDLKKSIELIRTKAPAYEFRTTYIPQLLKKEDLEKIRQELNCDSHWFVQCFRPVNCLDGQYCGYPAADPETVRKFLQGVNIRG